MHRSLVSIRSASPPVAARQAAILRRSLAWSDIGQGKDNARIYLKERPALAHEIENKVRVALGVRELPPLPGTEAPAKAAKLKAVAE